MFNFRKTFPNKMLSFTNFFFFINCVLLFTYELCYSLGNNSLTVICRLKGFCSPVIAADCCTGSLTALWQAAKLRRAKFLLGLRHVDQCRHRAVIMERKGGERHGTKASSHHFHWVE